MARLGGTEGTHGKHTHQFDAGMDSPAVSGEEVYTAQGSVTETPYSTDPLDLSPIDRAELSIRDDEVHSWIRNPDVWEQHEFSNRFVEFRKSHPTARMPTDAEGNIRVCGDLILVTHSKEAYEANERLREAKREEFENEIYDQTHPGQFRRPQTREEGEEMRARMDAEYEKYRAMGMIGEKSPTYGLNYEDAVARYSPEQIEAEEAGYRKGARHVDYDDEKWGEEIDRLQRQARGAKSYSFPGVKFGGKKQ